MGLTARFTKGSRKVELDGTALKLGRDFVPPPVNVSPLIATGTAANNRRGGVKRGESANDRQLSFSIVASGNSEAHCRMILHPILALLNEAGDESEPLYFEYKGNNDVPFEPVWGQYGGMLRYEIIHASAVEVWDLYLAAETREESIHYSLSLLIKPYAIGNVQRLASAIGGVLEDTIGTVDGRSRGLLVPEACTNKMTNPVFGHASYANGWTADASLIASENVDPDFIIPGTFASAKLTSFSTGQEFYQSINVGNTNTHVLSCYAKLPNGGAVSSTQAVLFYSVAEQTVYTPVGNGWFRLTAQVAGINASTNTGIQVKSGYTVYVTGFQFEQNLWRTPLCWGDLLGCAWSGTAHASTSTRTAARVRLPYSLFNLGETTIRVVWKTAYANILTVDDMFLWSTDSVGLAATFAFSSDTFVLSDAVNTAASAGTTFAGGDIIILHYVFAPNSLKIYRAGVEIATASAYTPNTNPSYIYIGSDATPDYQVDGTFLDFSIYDVALTAAQILADHNNIYSHVRGGDGLGQNLSRVPYVWTKDGDDVVDNHNDASEDNWLQANGIPGNAPAITTIEATSSSNFQTVDGLIWGLLTIPYHFDPYAYLGDDDDTTVDANSSGGGYGGASISTAETTISLTATLEKKSLALRNKQFCMVGRLAEATSGSTVKMRPVYLLGNQHYYGEYKTYTTATTFGLFISPFISIPDIKQIDSRRSGSFDFRVGLTRPTGVSTQVIYYDYFYAMFRPFVQVDLSNASTRATIHYQGKTAWAVDSTTVGQLLPLKGDAIELVPGIGNYLFSHLGATTTNPAITYTLTYNRIEVTPRWNLI